MIRALSLAVILIFSVLITNAQGWVSSLELAQTMAKASNKLILIDFYADWCGPCKKMDFETWSKPVVQEQMQKLLPAKINIDMNKSLAASYGIKAIPAVYIVDAWGNVLYKDPGYKTAGEMATLLSGFPAQVTAIYESLTALEENPKSPEINCIAAEAYQHSAKKSDGRAKSAFLKESNACLSKAGKLYKKEKNNTAMERVALLQIYNQLLAELAKAALKKLEKTGIDNLDESNRALACFIATKTYWALDNTEEAAAFVEKLKTCDDCAGYLEELAELNPDWN
jgi:thioredoxin-like negative regulator of GroEL